MKYILNQGGGVEFVSPVSGNVIDIKEDGGVYIRGIGGYDGTNPESASTIQAESVWEEGSGENGVQQKGAGSEAISEASLAAGKNSFAGLKGFYYKHIQTVGTAGTTVNIFLSQTQVVPTMSSSAVTKDTAIQPSEFLEIGDIITIINDSKYYNVLKINNFLSNGGGIQAKWIDAAAFTTIKETSPLNTDDYTVYCLAKPDAGIVDIGKGSVAIGEESKAINLGAFATGYKNTSWGNFGFTEGRENEAGYIGHAEGHHTKASGMRAHAEGYYTISNGSSSHAEGQHTRAEGQASHIEGHSNSDVSDETAAKNNVDVIADWNATKFSLAKGVASHVEGKDNLGLGNESHAEGYETIARGSYSHAEGYSTEANGSYSHAEGSATKANGLQSHAEGGFTKAPGGDSHAEGYFTTASGASSHAEGLYTIARNTSEHAEGRYNVSHSATTEYGSSGNTQHSVGIGTSTASTKNAFEIMQNGDAYLYGVGGYTGTSISGATKLQDMLTVSAGTYEIHSEEAGFVMAVCGNIIYTSNLSGRTITTTVNEFYKAYMSSIGAYSSEKAASMTTMNKISTLSLAMANVSMFKFPLTGGNITAYPIQTRVYGGNIVQMSQFTYQHSANGAQIQVTESGVTIYCA